MSSCDNKLVMPELPEVESICRMLSNHLVGRQVISVRVHLPRIVRRGNLDLLTGRTFQNVKRRGKFICCELDGGIRLFVHLRMTGTLLWIPASAGMTQESHLDANQETPSHVRAEIEFNDGCLLYRDIRTLGGIWVADDDFVPWQKLGVDPFDSEFTSRTLKFKFKECRIAIKQALLDQSIISGVGNIYASEALFRAGIHPAKPAGKLGLKEIDRLRAALVEILTAAIDAGGTTFRDFRLSDGRDGAFQQFLKVYGKAGKPCIKCGTAITRIVQAQRSTYFCPKCQRLRIRR